MKLPCADVEADVYAVETAEEDKEVGTVVCTVSTVLNNRTDHNGICVKIPCTDEEADVDAVETVEEEKEVDTVVCTVSNQ
jgi:5,10-methylene-tetrahydrofolate dehydrogenase/methenyl tetrahydrofolate cyclohydrolase